MQKCGEIVKEQQFVGLFVCGLDFERNCVEPNV